MIPRKLVQHINDNTLPNKIDGPNGIFFPIRQEGPAKIDVWNCQQWYQGLASLAPDAAMGRAFWQQLMAVRTAVNKAMEAQRAAGTLRGSLDAAVTLYCSHEMHASLHALGEELRFVLITSAATLLPLAAAGVDAVCTELPELRVQVGVAGEEKCERCWHRSADVGHSTAHPTLCGLCVENIDGDGERRDFA